MMRRKHVYVIDVSEEYQILIFKTFDTKVKTEWWDFYLGDGEFLEFQFSVPVNTLSYDKLEEFARSNFDAGNMSMILRNHLEQYMSEVLDT